MIPNQFKEAETLADSLGGEVLEAAFDPESMKHVMGLLTDLYSDKEKAAIREYSTNAWDAHMEAGVTQPIEVTTPTLMTPYLRIRDHGVGMDADDMRNLFRLYGKSTKRTNKDANGSMGIGRWSGLSLANTFTVSSVKDGRKIQVSVSRVSAGGVNITIVSDEATTESNGTEVTVPVPRHQNFETTAKHFFSFWDKGMVLLNGSEPSKRDDLTKVSDRIYYGEAYGPYHNINDYIFMGNVAYPLKEPLDVIRPNRRGLVMFVTMGGSDEVVFSPSRESLIYDDLTNATLEGLKKEYNDNLQKTLQATIDACADRSEALKTALQFKEDYSSSLPFTLNYKGAALPDVEAPFLWDEGSATAARSYGYTRDAKGNYGTFWYPNRTRNSVYNGVFGNYVHAKTIIFNAPSSITSMHKRKIRQYASDNSRALGDTFFIRAPKEKVTNHEWFEHRMIDWNEINKIKFKSASRAKADKNVVSYNGINDRGFSYAITDAKELKGKTVILIGSARDEGITDVQAKHIYTYIPNALILSEPRNRWDKITREHGAIYFNKAWEMVQKAAAKKIKKSHWYSMQAANIVKIDVLRAVLRGAKVDHTAILDKEVRDLYAAYTDYRNLSNDAQVLFHIVGGTYANVPEKYKIDRRVLLKKYPLFQAIQEYYLDANSCKEMIDYMNNKYKENK